MPCRIAGGDCQKRSCCGTWQCQDEHEIDCEGVVRHIQHIENQVKIAASARDEYLGSVLGPIKDVGVSGAKIHDVGFAIQGGMVVESFPQENRVVIDLGHHQEISAQAERVLDEAREALLVFLEKNKGYGSTAYVLGARGQYADMNRKFGKLKHTLWDGNEAVGEGVIEMLQDLAGHVLLTIDFIKEGNL